jgi:plasmid stabilization system protein ParE
MKEIRLRPGAVADLREIRYYTRRKWGRVAGASLS